MSQYQLVLRAADRGEGAVIRGLRRAFRLAAGVALDGLVSPLGPSELDIVNRATGEVVGKWLDPPSAESAPAWLPELQFELDHVGLDAFRRKYLDSTPLPTNPPAPAAPNPDRAAAATDTDVDETELDRRWEQLPPL